MQSLGVETPQLATGAPAQTAAERLKSWLLIGLCAAIGLAPLPLGSARPLAWDLLGLAVAALLGASLVLPSREVRFPGRELYVPLALFAAVALFVLLQASPFIPEGWRNPVWDQAAESLGRPVAGSIAIDRPAALTGLFRLLAYAGIFLLTYLLCRERARAYRALKLAIYTAGAYAIYGLAAFFTGNDLLLWLPKWAYREDLTGTFVNRNSFATYLGLAALAALAQVFVEFKDLHAAGTRREKLAHAIQFASAHIFVVLLVFVLLTALLLTHSRGGLIATVLGMAALAVALASAPSIAKGRGLWLALVLALVGIAAFVISGAATLERIMAGLTIASDDLPGRLAIYATTARAIAAHPLLGWGLGSFTSVFPIYRTSAVPLDFVNAAHDSYLELMLELGLPAAFALFGALLWLICVAIRGLRVRRRDAVFPCLAVAASTLVAAHSLVDFSLQIPAVTALYLFLLGLGVAQSRSSVPDAGVRDG